MTKPKNMVPNPAESDNKMLDNLQRETFEYFLNEVDPVTGLVCDKTQPGSPSSIAVNGMALTAYITGIEKKMLSRKDAIERILKILRFFCNSHQGTEPDATGYKGFYYHFLEMHTGKRAFQSEVSTIDTALFIAGALSVATYFTGNQPDEKEIRQLADKLYRRVDWQWALNKKTTLCHGWKPERGFLRYRWNKEYSEAILLYILALGSPTFPISPEGYKNWTATFKVSNVYGFDYLYAGPLFIHQFSHLWINFRGIYDDFNKAAGFDYFENSRRATYVQYKYAIENPKKFEGYGPHRWGLTASDGPGNKVLAIDGNKRKFYGYKARGAPFGPDDGTVSPWAVVASLPFAPEIIIEPVRHAIENLSLKEHGSYGFDASFNPTFRKNKTLPNGWVSPWKFGLNQGPIVIMIANYQSSLVWNIMQKCPYIIKGIEAAGFTGGWLEHKAD